MQHALLDVVILRPKYLKQVKVLASRLGVNAPWAWLLTLRWAGKAVLVAGADPVTAESVAASARDAGFKSALREGKPQGGLASFVAAHAGALGAAAFVAGAAVSAWRLFFVDSYSSFIHFLGLLWLHLVSRDMAVFGMVGRVAGILASLACGYAALIVLLTALAWLRLSPPLVAAAEDPTTSDHRAGRPQIMLIPAKRLFRWARLWPAATGIVLVAGGWFAAQRLFKPARQDGTASPLVAVPEAQRAQAPLPADPWKARAELDDRMRPRPDRRFLRAFEDVQQLSGARRPSCAADWAEGSWRIQCDGAPVATLPEVPAFADALQALRARARQLAPLHGAGVPEFAGMTDDAAVASLREAGTRWNAGDAGARHEAASAYVALAAQALDSMEVGDALPARALAALALDEDSHGAPEPQLQALLASAMGYAKSARAAASALPALDPVRQFVARDDAALEKAAQTGSPFLGLLWLRRLEDLHRMREAWEWRRRLSNAASVALLRAPLQHTLDDRAGSVREALPLVKTALERHHRWRWQDTTWRKLQALWRGHRSGPILDAFEQELEEVGEPGGAFDRGAIGAYYRGALYSGISVAAEQLVDGSHRPEEARSFLESLGTFPPGPARDLAIWIKAQLPYATAHEYTMGKPGAEALAASLRLGPAALEQALRFANGDEEASLRAERLVAARMDTRPEHRRLLATNALFHLRDVARARWACRALLAEQEDDSPGAADCARTLRDGQMLLSIARSAANPLWLRATALRFMDDVQLAPAAEIDAEFEKLLSLDDGWATVVQPYAKLLERRGEYAHARRVVESWLPTPRGQSVNESNVRVIRARMLYLEGNPQEAWRELEPLAAADDYGALMRASYVLSALGRKDEAEATARRRLARLPNNWESVTVLAELLWRHGKPDEAAGVLLHPPFRIEPDDWRTHVAPPFLHAFARRPEADALAAFASLERAGLIRRKLRELAVGVAAAQGPMGVALLTRLVASGPADPVLLVRTAAALHSMQGSAAAAAWLRARAAPEDVYSLARLMYAEREDALLWEALPDPLPQASAEDVWLLRAAAALRSPEARTGALHAHYAAAADDETSRLGRYLSRLSGEDAIRGASRRTRAAWALGTRAEAEGRRTDAVAWYQVAVAGGTTTEPERTFAMDALRGWAEEAVMAPDRAPSGK